jgi:adhesin/invasin
MARLSVAASIAVVLAGLLQVSCERVPLTAPTDSTISITSDRSVLPLNGQATLRAVVIESGGTPVHNGTTVTFTTTLGTVDPIEAKTVNGIATATFNAGAISGKSVINAFSGGATTGTATEITIGAAAAGSIAVSATPSSVSQSGGTVTIAALVLDASGNPLPGVNVTFSATTGQLSPTTALTDSTGVARAQLTTTQTSTVTATAGTATKDVTVTVSAAPTVTIDAPATGIAGVPIAVTVTASSGTTAAPRQLQSLTVDFGDGTVETRANVTGSAAFTHSYSQARGYTITATATDVSGNTGVASRAIVISRATPTVAVTLSDTTPQVNQIIGFTITGTPATGGPPIESVRALIDGTLAFSGSGSTGAFSKGFSAVGTYLLEVQATDAAGNVARSQQFITVTP